MHPCIHLGVFKTPADRMPLSASVAMMAIRRDIFRRRRRLDACIRDIVLSGRNRRHRNRRSLLEMAKGSLAMMTIYIYIYVCGYMVELVIPRGVERSSLRPNNNRRLRVEP